MSSQRTKLQEETHFRVLRLLDENPNMSQRELAAVADISVGGAHYVLSALVQKGYVKLENFAASKDKRRYAYLLTPQGASRKAALTRQFLVQKVREYEALRVEIEQLRSEEAGVKRSGVGEC